MKEEVKFKIIQEEETTDEDSDSEEEFDEIIYNNKKYFKDKADNIYEWVNEDIGELICKFVNEQVVLNKKEFDKKEFDEVVDFINIKIDLDKTT